jgi:hypothetical protein
MVMRSASAAAEEEVVVERRYAVPTQQADIMSRRRRMRSKPMTFSIAQQGDIEVAHRDIPRVIRAVYRSRNLLTEQEIDQCFEEINRNYSPETLRGLLVVLNEELALIHHRLVKSVEFAEIPAEYCADMVEAEDQKTEGCVRLAMQHAECLDEIGLIRMCLGYRLRQEASR